MGSIAIAHLMPSPPKEADHSVPVGGYAIRQALTAMRVGFDRSRLVYVEEVPMGHAVKWRIEDHGDGQRARWNRLEYKVHRRETTIKPGERLVIAEHPYSNGWVQTAPFKPPFKKGMTERPDPSVQKFMSATDFIAWVEAQPKDYWETGAYLTAGISEPDVPWLSDKKARNIFGSALYVYGVCDDFEGHARKLYETNEAQQLLSMTDKNIIKFWFAHAKLGRLPKLREGTMDEAEHLLSLSIVQALAGPHEDSATWIGRPVIEKVDDIYRGHLNNKNRTGSD